MFSIDILIYMSITLIKSKTIAEIFYFFLYLRHKTMPEVDNLLSFLFWMFPQLILIKLWFLFVFPSPTQTVFILYTLSVRQRTYRLVINLYTQMRRWFLINLINDKVSILKNGFSMNWFESFIKSFERLIVIRHAFVLILILVSSYNSSQ